MINPGSLIRAFDKHWDAIECFVLLGRDQITYERNDVLALLGKVYVHESDEQHVDRLQHLVNTELLIEMSHSNTLQLNENVRQFAAVCCMNMSWVCRTSLVNQDDQMNKSEIKAQVRA